MIIYLDLDGVIINFVKGVFDWFELSYEPEKVIHWDSLQGIVGIDNEDFWSRLKTRHFWEELDFYAGAKDFISELQKHGKVVLCTSPAHGCAGYRQNWIQKNLPEFFNSGDYIITPNKENCATSNTLLIDDSDKNCEKFRQAGGFTILYPQPWNKYNDRLENKNERILNNFIHFKRGQ